MRLQDAGVSSLSIKRGGGVEGDGFSHLIKVMKRKGGGSGAVERRSRKCSSLRTLREKGGPGMGDNDSVEKKESSRQNNHGGDPLPALHQGVKPRGEEQTINYLTDQKRKERSGGLEEIGPSFREGAS